MNFILKGSEISALQLKGISKSRTSMEFFERNIKLILKFMHDLHGTCFWYNEIMKKKLHDINPGE
jgi:hypothetical protein